MSKKKGVFITLEGGEGVGKTTQIRKLEEALQERGIYPVITREPGGTTQAERVRGLLVQRDGGHWDPLSEALLLFAARREHLVRKIWPAIERGQWVISDRFADSTVAFQGFGMGLQMDIIKDLYKMTVGDFEPDLTFILDLPVEVGLSRSAKKLGAAVSQMESSEDRYERMGKAFHERLREGFLEIAKKNKRRCVIINADADPAVVHASIMAELDRRFPPGKLKAVH